MRCRAFNALATLLMLAGCGTSGSNPCQRPAEVNFSVQGASGTPFHVLSFTANGISHDFPQSLPSANTWPDGNPLSPHTFYFINANYPVIGQFTPDAEATEEIPVFLRSPDLTTIVDSGVIPLPSPNATPTPVTLTTHELISTSCPVPSVGPQIRVEVFETSGVFDVPFLLTVGDENDTFLACGVDTSRGCGTPITVYFDNAQNSFDAIVTKSAADTHVIALQVYFNEQPSNTPAVWTLRGSDQATDDSRTAKVHVEF